MAETSDATVGRLIKSALDDIRDLVREELALAQAELRQELNKMMLAAVHFGAAGLALWFAAMFILVAVALGAAAVFAMPVWAAFGMVAVLLVVIGGLFLVAGRRAVRDVRPLPRTIETVKENFK